MVIGASETRWVCLDTNGTTSVLSREEVWALADEGWALRFKRDPLAGYTYRAYRTVDGVTERRVYSAVIASPQMS